LPVWADEDGSATEGLHANFKLSTAGEELYLCDTDANSNTILDSISFGPQDNDFSWGRFAQNADEFVSMNPTPNVANE